MRQVHPDAVIGLDGIQPTTLASEPALRYDYSYTEDTVHFHGRDVIAFSGGKAYGVGFFTADATFDTMANDVATIYDSFRFVTRSVVAGVYSDPQGRFTFAAPPQYDLIPTFLEDEADDALSIATFSPNSKANGDDDSRMNIRTFSSSSTFDKTFNTYSTVGLNTLAERPGVEIGKDAVRHTMLGGRPAGIMDWYQPTDTGVRLHVYQIFTVTSGEQYIMTFVLRDDDHHILTNPIDVTLASFQFQVS